MPDKTLRIVETYVRQMLMGTGSMTLDQINDYAPKYAAELVSMVRHLDNDNVTIWDPE